MSLIDRLGRFIDDVLLLPEGVRERLDAAEDALEAGDARSAAALFEGVLRDRDTLARAAVGLAQARESLGELDAARVALARARELEPDDPEVALYDARLSLARGEAARAADAARAAAARFGSDMPAKLADACVLQARAERMRGRSDRAARELKKALTLAPERTALRAELVEALVDAGRHATARAVATAVSAEDLDDAGATRLGVALDRIGAADLARAWLERGASAGSDRALLALARRDFAEGAVDLAEERARRAVARGAGADALALLAEVVLSTGRAGEATDALATAASARGGDVELLRAAARVAPVNDARELVRRADALDARGAGDPAASAARAWAALAAADFATARAVLAEAAEESEEPRLLLAAARLALESGDARAALERLDIWALREVRVPFASTDRSLADALRRDALRALWRGPEGEVDLAAAIDAVERFARERELVGAERAAGRLRDELDRPLLLAVLGEFNAGKSTFINAFVGADVAPTGIVPTTATLNVLRGGAERRVRVVRADGTTREGHYEDLKRLLAECAHAEPSVDHVEIVLPSETLERVWILDTPGTNAIDPDHERLAKEAARRADAVLWIFDAGQAGKGTEARVLAEMRARGRVVVPVLNKVDRLTPDQLESVQRVLRRELGDLGTAVAIAARPALRARLGGDDAAYVASGFGALLQRLEVDVFSRSRELKRGACAGRLLEILDAALETEARAVGRHDERVAALDAMEQSLRDAARKLDAAVDEAVTHLSAELDVAFTQAAEEVLAFVRPRRSRFARHGADPEDRAFLAEALELRLGHAADDLVARLVPRVRGTLAGPVEALALAPDALDRRVRASLGGAISLYVGFQRGMLRGGGLRRFFADVLPSATLEVSALRDALRVAAADPRAELEPPLADALSDLVASIEADRAQALSATRRERESIRNRVYAPLRALREVLGGLIGAPGRPDLAGPAIA